MLCFLSMPQLPLEPALVSCWLLVLVLGAGYYFPYNNQRKLNTPPSLPCILLPCICNVIELYGPLVKELLKTVNNGESRTKRQGRKTEAIGGQGNGSVGRGPCC